MSRLLVVAFKPSDVAAGSGLAQALSLPFDALLLSGSAEGLSGPETIRVTGWTEIPPADSSAQAVAPTCAGYTHIAAVSSMASKDLLARVAGLMDAAMVTDVVAVLSPTRFQRPIVAGSLLATVEVSSTPVLMTFRPSGFPVAEGAPPPVVETLSLAVKGSTKRVEVHEQSGGRPDLAQAKVVVSGGRPLGDSETYERLIGRLADALGGAAGATRAAVDNGIAPNELQVGQTGKVVAPDLYIAAGISGSTQHMAGIKDSKTIVAINKDPDAPIFEFADLGLVADLFQAIPELLDKVEQ